MEETQENQAHRELIKYVKSLYAVAGYMIKTAELRYDKNTIKAVPHRAAGLINGSGQ
ncbi:MAG: hypothetical protein LBU09_02140 [Endomicrobium sp.]|nr:hypothetical protein [Endomicrobium sp.]